MILVNVLGATRALRDKRVNVIGRVWPILTASDHIVDSASAWSSVDWMGTNEIRDTMTQK